MATVRRVRKYKYHIAISGESAGECVKELSPQQARIVEDIFDCCESEYCGGYIVKLPNIPKLQEKFDKYLQNETVANGVGKMYITSGKMAIWNEAREFMEKEGIDYNCYAEEYVQRELYNYIEEKYFNKKRK